MNRSHSMCSCSKYVMKSEYFTSSFDGRFMCFRNANSLSKWIGPEWAHTKKRDCPDLDVPMKIRCLSKYAICSFTVTLSIPVNKQIYMHAYMLLIYEWSPDSAIYSFRRCCVLYRTWNLCPTMRNSSIMHCFLYQMPHIHTHTNILTWIFWSRSVFYRSSLEFDTLD